MNYMKQVAELLGVNMGEKFVVINGKTMIPECYIDKCGLHNKDIVLMPQLLSKVLNGTAKIIKKPFRPKYGEEYWYIWNDGTIGKTENEEATFDSITMLIGNCFCSRTEAEAHKDEIMAKYREVMGNVRKET